MKAILSILISLSLAAAWATPFRYQFNFADGTPNTNTLTIQAWPPASNTVVVYNSSNIVYGGGSATITCTPNTNGFGTNAAYPNSYRGMWSNLNAAFYFTLPDTTNQVDLGFYISNVPQVGGSILSLYGIITNMLGYSPATNGGSIAAAQLPQIGTIGVTNANGAIVTNAGTGTIICWTNLATGVAPTLTAPDGSLLIATNGNIFTRSNATWINLK